MCSLVLLYKRSVFHAVSQHSIHHLWVHQQHKAVSMGLQPYLCVVGLFYSLTKQRFESRLLFIGFIGFCRLLAINPMIMPSCGLRAKAS